VPLKYSSGSLRELFNFTYIPLPMDCPEISVHLHVNIGSLSVLIGEIIAPFSLLMVALSHPGTERKVVNIKHTSFSL